MKPIIKIATVLSAIALASMLGCASTTNREGTREVAKHESTGEYVDDTVITTKVKAAILNESTLKSTEINVETYKGVVQLSGFVSSRSNIDTAINVARNVKGVTSVRNDMRVK